MKSYLVSAFLTVALSVSPLRCAASPPQTGAELGDLCAVGVFGLSGDCTAFIKGVEEGYWQAAFAFAQKAGVTGDDVFTLARPLVPFCPPIGITDTQRAAAVSSYVRANPDMVKINAAKVVVNALRASYPCP